MGMSTKKKTQQKNKKLSEAIRYIACQQTDCRAQEFFLYEAYRKEEKEKNVKTQEHFPCSATTKGMAKHK